MSEPAETPAKTLTHLGERRYFLLVFFSIIVAMCLVVVALAIYNRSGAAQIDLSRPGYSNETRKQASSVKQDFSGFPSKGELDEDALDEFLKLYDEQSRQTIGADAYGDSVLTDNALNIEK